MSFGKSPTGGCAGSTLVPPATFIAQRKGFHLLADVAALGLAYQHQGDVTTRKFLRENPTIVRNFVKIVPRGRLSLENRPRHGNEDRGKIFALGDPELLKRTYKSSIDENKLPMKQYPTVEGIQDYHRSARCD